MTFFECKVSKAISKAIMEYAKNHDHESKFQLEPVYSDQKSFYGKARVECRGRYSTLYSYDTPVMVYDSMFDQIQRLWFGYSRTTQKHVDSFLAIVDKMQYAGKHNFDSLEGGEWYD